MPLFKRDPTKKLNKLYQDKMKAAMTALRNGDVRQNAALVAEADELKAKLDRLTAEKG